MGHEPGSERKHDDGREDDAIFHGDRGGWTFEAIDLAALDDPGAAFVAAVGGLALTVAFVAAAGAVDWTGGLFW